MNAKRPQRRKGDHQKAIELSLNYTVERIHQWLDIRDNPTNCDERSRLPTIILDDRIALWRAVRNVLEERRNDETYSDD